ncbi:MAG: polymer-forming cytoskeletal protein [Chitinophagales bacterium]|nr:polymer-forming cytoskeletal protein [Chitinophagales bacterium]
MFGDSSSKKPVVQDAFSANTVQNGTIIVGQIQSEGNIRIDGKLEGSLSTKGKLVVGASGRITGDVVCMNANVEGLIDGKIEVHDMLVLKQGAKIEGDIQTKKLVVEEGATFNGKISMGAKIQKAIIKNGNNDFQKQAV